MNNYDDYYYYYIVYEYEINGGMAQSSCEYKKQDKPITYLSDIQAISVELKNINKSKKEPIITFYTLLRKEKRSK
jgi:hypothetical protein